MPGRMSEGELSDLRHPTGRQHTRPQARSQDLDRESPTRFRPIDITLKAKRSRALMTVRGVDQQLMSSRPRQATRFSARSSSRSRAR